MSVRSFKEAIAEEVVIAEVYFERCRHSYPSHVDHAEAAVDTLHLVADLVEKHLQEDSDGTT